ncbi:hypothetical protein FNF31_03330 [Cafeteria roenbergensis]|uniref:Uncharacterized protein n=1 Tax=Cafeteria roenbergensis TaxID=33653 RepID=A0A5A8DAM3_CAFRO|nr:hypothetical protein FNF31_03330 [Cafeteria roenbergensis]
MVARAPEDRGSARKPERDGAADTAAAGSADAFDADAPNDENGDGDMPARNDDDEDSTGPPQARKGSSSRSIGASVASLAAALGVTTVKPRLVPVDGSLDRRRAESFPAAWANQELADAADEALAAATGSPTAGGAAANAAGRGGGASGGGKPMAEPLPALPDSPEQGFDQPRQPTSVIVTDASGRPWLCRAKMTASPRPDTPLRRCRPNLRIDQDLIVEPYGEEDDEERWPDEFQDRPKPEKEPEWDADAGASAASPAEEQQPESGQQPEQDDAYAAAAADDASGGAEGTGGDAAADDASR